MEQREVLVGCGILTVRHQRSNLEAAGMWVSRSGLANSGAYQAWGLVPAVSGDHVVLAHRTLSGSSSARYLVSSEQLETQSLM